MVIKRDFHLKRLIDAQGDGFVKIVTDIRRCGKSHGDRTLCRPSSVGQRIPR